MPEGGSAARTRVTAATSSRSIRIVIGFENPILTLLPRRQRSLGHYFLVLVTPGDPARGLKDIQRLLVQLLGDLNASLPAAQGLVPPDRGSQEFAGHVGEKLRLELRHFARRGRLHPFPGPPVRVEKDPVAFGLLIAP